MIRVLAVADSPMGMTALVGLVGSQPDLEVTGRFVTEGGLEDLLGAADVDVVLLGLTGDEEHSQSTIRAMARVRRSAPVVLVVEDAPAGLRGAALAAGARAVLPLNSPPDELRAALEAVAKGFLVLHPEDRPARAEVLSAGPAAARRGGGPLTARELQVLGHLADGLGNKAIAAKFGISERTVKFHVGSIFAKLDVDSRTEAVIAGLRRGLIML